MSWAVSGENAGLPTLIPRLFVPQLPARNTEPTVAISLSKKQEIALEVIKKKFSRPFPPGIPTNTPVPPPSFYIFFLSKSLSSPVFSMSL